ncbi:MAG: phosphogluconate dehydratase [Gammaproteobacteria bacterium]|nr:phosphogluconate dehydratase [Gammaproteobacteria bacterium]NNM00976.1 phosphogluconate dehydratase [Gammaproteobacteria bacterium]
MTELNQTLARVTERIIERSHAEREDYLGRMREAGDEGNRGQRLSCGNLAHAYAAAETADKLLLRGARAPNIAIVSSYNDMLSAHQPFQTFPDVIRAAARASGATAQFAGGTPAMCDGVTQGQAGMELSLFSRDVIAMSTAVAMSHDVFDGALYLGICDKIVPGLLIGALSFGHLPALFVPGGPMQSGLSNDEKARIRRLFAEGKVGRDELLEAEMGAYHGPGTCTFYGTANSNQMLMEIMGLHVPGSAFVHPNTPLRDALTADATRRAVLAARDAGAAPRLADVVSERAIVNGIVGLLATGGSTNHTIHLVAIARAAGITVDWDDFSALSAVVPLLARVYPNGSADVNHFQAAGGIGYVIRELLDAGLLHEQVATVSGGTLREYTREPFLDGAELVWREAAAESLDRNILRPVAEPFDDEGGIKLLTGNLGRSVIKVSAVAPEHRVVRAPAVVFEDQNDLLTSFKAGELNRDFVAVVRGQGPAANGMPELHKLTPTLQILQKQGHQVALVTDGRMSGASGSVPAAIHVTPEARHGGVIGQVRDGDLVVLDTEHGTLEIQAAGDALDDRPAWSADTGRYGHGVGRELFTAMRANALPAELGAGTFGDTASAQAAPEGAAERTD